MWGCLNWDFWDSVVWVLSELGFLGFCRGILGISVLVVWGIGFGVCLYAHSHVAFVDGYPPPAPFQGRRVAFALRLSQEVGSWGRMYCPGPELRSQRRDLGSFPLHRLFRFRLRTTPERGQMLRRTVRDR